MPRNLTNLAKWRTAHPVKQLWYWSHPSTTSKLIIDPAFVVLRDCKGEVFVLKRSELKRKKVTIPCNSPVDLSSPPSLPPS